ncbi:MAG: hypothetical protein GYA55_08205, partial [SAR324 cluster bacterium]|nr:hypothetical protein [SAR324 cluster bacterium]
KDSEVNSFEKNSNHKVVARVAKLFYHRRARIIRIHVDTGALDTTKSHNFFVKGKGWVKVKDLRVGDKLLSFSGAELEVGRKERVMRTGEVYNINVQNAHTYFVFPDHSSEAVLVHNEKGNFIKTPTTCPLYPTSAPENLPTEVPTCIPTP